MTVSLDDPKIPHSLYLNEEFLICIISLKQSESIYFNQAIFVAFNVKN